ncbi:MAG: phosphoribosylformylglycinamidine synthase subunit PurS [Candidatus Dormibacteraeota bacterium]|nr:phosphoribosylformylglycinamidine synthase subunit PurS [Candidatus Dormibacteraeota bacterium]
MTYRAEIFVTLKPVVNDPEGITIHRGLQSLGFDSVQEVRSGKYLVLTLHAADEPRARALVEAMAGDLLANSVIEDYRVAIAAVAEPAGFREVRG